MTIYRRRDGRLAAEEEALDGDIVRDGYSVSVPLMLRDGVRRIRNDEASVLADSLLVTDGAGGAAGLHRPGPRLPAVDADTIRRRRAVRDAYAAAELADANAWRNPQPSGGAPAVPAKEPGHLTADALALLDAKEAAYGEAAWADENAWRNAKP